MTRYLIEAFLALGGAALIWKAVGSNARYACHVGLGKLLIAFPVVRSFVVANKDKIENILEEAEKGLEEAINEANAPDPVEAKPEEKPK